jgi:hypothetical protein
LTRCLNFNEIGQQNQESCARTAPTVNGKVTMSPQSSGAPGEVKDPQVA